MISRCTCCGRKVTTFNIEKWYRSGKKCDTCVRLAEEIRVLDIEIKELEHENRLLEVYI